MISEEDMTTIHNTVMANPDRVIQAIGTVTNMTWQRNIEEDHSVADPIDTLEVTVDILLNNEAKTLNQDEILNRCEHILMSRKLRHKAGVLHCDWANEWDVNIIDVDDDNRRIFLTGIYRRSS